MIAKTVVSAAVFILSASVLRAQPATPPAPAATAAPAASTQPSSRDQIVDEMATAGIMAATRGVARPFQSTFGAGGEGEIIAYLVAVHSERAGYKALLQAMEARAVKQIGSASSSSGSTSVATKGLIPDILGVAVESGAINRDVSGTTLTFRATPAGVIKALQGKTLAETYIDYSRSASSRLASRLSAAASFDTSKGDTPGTFTASANQLTSWAVHAQLVNHRDPAAARYATLWQGTLHTPEAKVYQDAAQAIDNALAGWDAFQVWEKDLRTGTVKVETALAASRDIAAAGAAFKTLLQAQLPKLEKLAATPADVTSALDAYVASLAKVQRAIDNVYDAVATGDLVTFDWSTARSTTLPDLYTVTGIWDAAFGASRQTDFTLNVALNFYRSVPAGAQHQLKSVEITGQFDHPLGSLFALPAATLTIAGRLSHLPNDTVAAADAASAAAAAARGTIGVVQAKITIPVKGSGVKIPLSITASNRTELIKEKDVRASFGFSFDLDPLIGGLFEKKP